MKLKLIVASILAIACSATAANSNYVQLKEGLATDGVYVSIVRDEGRSINAGQSFGIVYDMSTYSPVLIGSASRRECTGDRLISTINGQRVMMGLDYGPVPGLGEYCQLYPVSAEGQDIFNMAIQSGHVDIDGIEFNTPSAARLISSFVPAK